jgi:hypothetical protein
MSRQYLRGWAANKTSEARRNKLEILSKLEELDKKQECQDVEGNKWRERYQLEACLEQIYYKEEIYWQQRCSEKWLLKGDANTAFFRSCANGRRRKTRICALDVENGTISDQKGLKAHVVKFYKQLFRSSSHLGVRLSSSFWSEEEQLDEEDKRRLVEPFSE